MSGKLTEDSQPIAEINIVPFVDIILVILIIFMVTVPFIIKTGIALNLPATGTGKAVKDTKIHIAINADGSVLLNGDAFDIQKLKEQLTTQNKDTTMAVISADKNVLHGKVISVISSIKSLGLKKVTIAVKKAP